MSGALSLAQSSRMDKWVSVARKRCADTNSGSNDRICALLAGTFEIASCMAQGCQVAGQFDIQRANDHSQFLRGTRAIQFFTAAFYHGKDIVRPCAVGVCSQCLAAFRPCGFPLSVLHYYKPANCKSGEARSTRVSSVAAYFV